MIIDFKYALKIIENMAINRLPMQLKTVQYLGGLKLYNANKLRKTVQIINAV